jgi:hypothetical protein
MRKNITYHSQQHWGPRSYTECPDRPRLVGRRVPKGSMFQSASCSERMLQELTGNKHCSEYVRIECHPLSRYSDPGEGATERGQSQIISSFGVFRLEKAC